MTGYGRSERQAAEVGVEVEVRSVNGRHLAVRHRIPPEWMRLADKVEEVVRSRLQRGAVELVVHIRASARSRQPEIDQSVLEVYRRALRRLGGGDAATLLRLPGVVSLAEVRLPARTVDRLLSAALRESLDALVAAREREGRRLKLVLQRELRELARHLAVVQRRVPAALLRHRDQLRRRLGTLLGGQPLDASDPLLLREVAALADRSDVTEELDRLQSHLTAFAACLDGGGPVGRELDFQLQEMGREVNTLGSKALDAELSARVVRMKACVERLREQAANIE